MILPEELIMYNNHLKLIKHGVFSNPVTLPDTPITWLILGCFNMSNHIGEYLSMGMDIFPMLQRDGMLTFNDYDSR